MVNMIKKHIWLIALISILAVLLAACAPVPTPAPPTITPTILPTYTAAPSLSPAPPSTETLVPSPTPVPVVRFAVIGDYGEEGEDLAAVADLIDSWEVDFIITTGDNNYPIGAPDTIDANIGQYFHEYIYPYKGEYGEGAEINRFFPSLGNHDWVWVGAEPYLDYFELPGNERYYSFRWDFVDFFALDSDTAEPDGVSRTSPQAEWLQAGLAASDAPWQVVYFHHAPYSSGHHGPTTYMQWPFEEWGADVVFSGHDHTYERLRIDDLLYFVVGISGRSRYDIYDPYPGSEFRYREEYGALLVEAIPTEMRFWFYNIEGELIDAEVVKR